MRRTYYGRIRRRRGFYLQSCWWSGSPPNTPSSNYAHVNTSGSDEIRSTRICPKQAIPRGYSLISGFNHFDGLPNAHFTCIHIYLQVLLITNPMTTLRVLHNRPGQKRQLAAPLKVRSVLQAANATSFNVITGRFHRLSCTQPGITDHAVMLNQRPRGPRGYSLETDHFHSTGDVHSASASQVEWTVCMGKGRWSLTIAHGQRSPASGGVYLLG